ncbi:winged helix DNA-binding domain-containing protein [Ornithinimicrobium sp. W1679]|uniref:winged helix DNA-binding domain-containing protein n=1 Tax=unclassified Ornithinimicrobium TaxID=2615080 RepID=UPI003CEE13EC
MRLVDDRERRSRLAVRHALHPRHRVPDPVAATRAMTVLHATEAATVHLAVRARTDPAGPPSPQDVDRVLYQDRSLVKQLAMRRTLFVLPRDLLPAALGSASARVAQTQRRALARDVERHGVAPDGDAWVERARRAVLERLAGSEPVGARRLREEVPELSGEVLYSPGKRYGGAAPLAPRVLTLLGAEGRVVRGPNVGHWRLNRPTWVLAQEWLGEQVEPVASGEGYAELVRRWLHSFGPGTLEDVQWWLGSTRTAARAALAAVGAVEVSLQDGSAGWLLPDDLAPTAPVEPWAALLPTLDPTTMGWKGRNFYLDPALVPHLFDTNGNAGTTAWWDGRVVGAWVQDEEGVVRVVPAPGVALGTDARAALAEEAGRLTRWLDGVRIGNVYSSPLMKQARLP